MNKSHTIIGIFVIVCIMASCAGCTDAEENSGAEVGNVNLTQVYENDEILGAPAISPYPYITPSLRNDGYVDRTFNFKFEKKEHTITIPVNTSVYYGAKSAEKRWPSGTDWDDEEWIAGYYSAFFSDPHLDEFYDGLLDELHVIQRRERLSDSEYLELMITFVQQIPYDSFASSPRFPIEVIYDRTGDCDETSLLLTGMLSREGYDTALLMFPSEGHAAAGIRIDLAKMPQFRVYKSPDHKKYVYIESTAPTYIGLYSEPYETAHAITAPLGNGTKPYTHMNYVCHITDNLKKIEDRIVFMKEQMEEWEADAEALERKLASGKYETQKDWNSDHSEYIRLIDRHNDYIPKLQKNIKVYNYIIEHPYDVKGVYWYIDNSHVMDMDY